jgi:hypothetical protein
MPMLRIQLNFSVFLPSVPQRSGVKHVFGAILRIRDDIWQRMSTILELLDVKNGIDEYRRIYQFTEPLKTGFNLATNQLYSKTTMQNLEQKILERGMLPYFPEYMKSRRIERRFLSNGARSEQLTLMKYI